MAVGGMQTTRRSSLAACVVAGSALAVASALWAARRWRQRTSRGNLWQTIRRHLRQALAGRGESLLVNCRVPALGIPLAGAEVDKDGFVLVDIKLQRGVVKGIYAASAANSCRRSGLQVAMQGRILCPRFVDAHTHLMKTHLHPRCPNPTGAMNDALACEASDRQRWLQDHRSKRSIARRLEFALQCAAAHGSRAVRTHLDGTADSGEELRDASYAEFDAARARWLPRGVELQGVANMFLAHWGGDCGKSTAEARKHVEEASRHPGVVLGAYCPKAAETGLFDAAHFGKWFDALFALAAEFDLPVDMHIDEHNDSSPGALALPHLVLALKRAQQNLNYSRSVVLGHVTALSLAEEARRADMVAALASLGPQVTVVANPLTNVWLQDRRGTDSSLGAPIDEGAPRTPLWRGMTLLQELHAAGVRVAAASDNVRDWWYPYGDYDALDVFKMAIHLAHLDTTHIDGTPPAKWFSLVTDAPAVAMGVTGNGSEFLQQEAPLCACIFNARSVSELLARPQNDRAVVVGGSLLHLELPDFEELDDLVAESTEVPDVARSNVQRGASLEAGKLRAPCVC